MCQSSTFFTCWLFGFVLRNVVLNFEKRNKKLISRAKWPDEIFKVHLVDDSDNVISNYCIVHWVESLIKCNPDPQQEKLDSLFEQEYPDVEGITELLEFVEYKVNIRRDTYCLPYADPLPLLKNQR